MPNRIIKETICTSEDIAALSIGAEVLFYHLIVKADDFGAYYGNPTIIKNTCFPLRASAIKLSQVKSWLQELENAGILRIYTADDEKDYVMFEKWAKHQTIRAKKSKYPLPASNCKQMQADASNILRNPIQSNPIQYNTIQSEEEQFFEKLWAAYPKQTGKRYVTDDAKKKLYAAGDRAELAVQNYINEIGCRDLQYVKGGSTFFNGAWEDYVHGEKTEYTDDGFPIIKVSKAEPF